MAETLRYEIVEPQQALASSEGSMVIIPSIEGDIGVMPSHAAMVVSLKRGIVYIFSDSVVVDRYFIDGGIATIMSDSVVVITESGLSLRDLSESDVQLRIDSAQEALDQASESEKEAAQRRVLFERNILEALREASPY